ncbi:JmjC domain-containing protein [Actinoplanes couchii]|uniref:JmjC domain-containing protein n=1 Tax=Actinoplanes couchii TaxID=403638 RepID=A0ABQ3XN35_9ACTN|nr:cupin domain-containing protein [Actinoplanes couchii]MDR6317924.1 ribosomal protein L16 Arg81 hydroxylase [Actinoplanes couchii]GID59911.1 hypothetical protein Aco03nite_083150 [Actinoplanes couchii]
MVLEMLLDSRTAEEFMHAWPDKPQVLPLPAGGQTLTHSINANTILRILDTGCYPPVEVNVIKNDQTRHPRMFTTNDRLDPVKLRRWRDRGDTVQLRHLERWIPAMAALTRSIQTQTGCTNYVSAFVTPAGQQGLQHHWDPYLSIVIQLAGTKTWDIWKPKVIDPTRAHLTAVQTWQDHWIEEWTANGPDLSFDLVSHEVLVLPRGWVHNPYNSGADESVHITVVIKERTPFWITEKLTATVINDQAFRRSISAADLASRTLADCVDRTRERLVQHLNDLDSNDFAHLLRTFAVTEVDQDIV